MKKIRILFIEENRLLREGISALLNKQQDMKVITNTEDILVLIDKLNPDIVLIDIELKYHNSLQLVKYIMTQSEDSKIILMDLIPSQANMFEYVQAGVLGFILQESNSTYFINAIRKVAKGFKVLPPSLADSLFSQIVEQKKVSTKPELLTKLVQLSKREREMSKLISDGLTNKEIAQELKISTYTVKSHVHNILEKLSLHTRVQIAKYSNFIESSRTATDTTSLLD